MKESVLKNINVKKLKRGLKAENEKGTLQKENSNPCYLNLQW